MEARNFYKFMKPSFILLSFMIIVALAFLMRTYDFNREASKIGDFVPFTLESAMMYSYAREVAEKGYLPDKDVSLVATKDLSISRQMSISMEYFLGYGYRLKNLFYEAKDTASSIYGDNTDFSNWARLQIRLWISLSAGLIFLWLLILRCSWIFSIFGGFLFAVSPAAIARATGQDLIRENFAIPIILATFVCYFWYLKAPRKYKLLLFALAALGALASWDMTQLCFSAWGIFEIFRLTLFDHQKNLDNGSCLNPKEAHLATNKTGSIWITFFLVSIFAALVIPYLNEHKLIFSPLVCIILPMVVVLAFATHCHAQLQRCLRRGKGIQINRFRQIILTVVLFVFFFCLWFFIFRKFGYAANYSHFAHLIKAKLYFGNVKPLNPNLLNFDARILWTPALHSATKKIFWTLFHYSFPLFIISLLVVLFLPRTRQNFMRKFPRISLPLSLTIFYFVLFVLMVRFHVLVIPFLCISLALIFDNLYELFKSRWKVLFLVTFGLLVLTEAGWFFNLTRIYYNNIHTNVDLVKWFNSNPKIKNKVILADFTVSPMLKAYAGTKIVLQPKFELGKTRNLVKQYLNILFYGTEKDLNDFCSKYNVDYFIFDKALASGGKNNPMLHPWSERYVAAAIQLKEESPAYRCYYKPDQMRLFYKLDEIPPSQYVDESYTIFKVITQKNIRQAKKLYQLASKAIEANNISLARKLISSAALMDPNSVQIRYLFYQLFHNKWPIITLNGLKNDS